MRTYMVRMGGYDVRLKLSDEDAEARGFTEATRPAKVAETKKGAAENKAAPKTKAPAGKRRPGRPRIQRDSDQ